MKKKQTLTTKYDRFPIPVIFIVVQNGPSSTFMSLLKKTSLPEVHPSWRRQPEVRRDNPFQSPVDTILLFQAWKSWPSPESIHTLPCHQYHPREK